MQLIRLTLGVMALLILSACGADPRRDADAYATRTQANEQARNEAQERRITQDLHEAEMQKVAAEQARRDALQPWRISAGQWAWTSIKIFGSVSLAVGLLAIGFAFARTSYGISNVAIEAASVRANLIPLDRVTRQFPLVRQVHGNRIALQNPNTGSLIMLDVPRDEDRQLITAMGATQLAGVIAQEARQSSDPAGLAMMNTPMVHAQEDGLYIGSAYIESPIPLPKGDA